MGVNNLPGVATQQYTSRESITSPTPYHYTTEPPAYVGLQVKLCDTVLRRHPVVLRWLAHEELFLTFITFTDDSSVVSEVAADLAIGVQVHDTTDADDGVQWNQIIQRNAEQLAVKEPSRRLMKRLVWTQVVVSKRQALSTANKLHASLHNTTGVSN